MPSLFHPHPTARQAALAIINLDPSVAALWRGRQLIAVTTAVALILALLFLLICPARYSAQTQIQLLPLTPGNLFTDAPTAPLPLTDNTLRTEAIVLRSRALAQRVLQKNPAARPGPGILQTVKSAARYFLFPGSSNAQSLDALRTAQTDAFLSHLSVNPQMHTAVITVSYADANPQRAAQLVNALAAEYLNAQLDAKLESARRNSAWMTDRLTRLRAEVAQAEQAAQNFRRSHNLTQARGVTLTEQQLSDLNGQLILARAKQAEAQARLAQAAGTTQGLQSSAEVLASPLIQNLRMQEAEVRRTLAQMATRYGPKHPNLQTAKNELANIQGKITDETLKVRGSLANDAAVAQTRVEALQSQLAALQGQGSADDLKLAELERQATAARTLYESLLARSKQAAQLDIAQTDARIIAPAEAPLSPSFPNAILTLALAAILGLLTGATLALLLNETEKQKTKPRPRK